MFVSDVIDAHTFAARHHTCCSTVMVAALVGVLMPPAPASAVSISPSELHEVSLINQMRVSKGLPSVVIDRRLTAITEWMATDMATRDYFSHVDHLGRDPFQRMSDFHYPLDTWRGEILAAGNSDAAVTFRQWDLSPAHLTIMLQPHYRAVGIARACDAQATYNCYWAVDFGSRVVAAYHPTVDPGKVGALSVARSATSGLLSWRAASSKVGIGGYQVWAAETGSASLRLTGTTATRSFRLTGLAENTTYRAVIAPVNMADAHGGFTYIQFSTDVTVPIAPRSQRLAERTRSSLKISWRGASDNVTVTHYRVYRWNGHSWKSLGDTTHRSYAVMSLKPGRRYYFREQAFDSAGNRSSASVAFAARTWQ